MPSVSISLPASTIAKLQEKDISPTKIAQRGVELLLEIGPEAVEQLKKDVEKLKIEVAAKNNEIDTLREKSTQFKHKFIKKCIELIYPDLHQKFLNKENPEFDILDIREKTGEKWLGLSNLAEAYDNINLLDYKGVPE